MQEEQKQSQQTPSSDKRPYEKPEIIDYGSVRDLTRGLGSKPTFDMMSGSRRT